MQSNDFIPEVVCIGFFCHDVHQDGYILGGTASYASLLFQKLGKKTAVLTSVGGDFLFFNKFKKAGINIYNKLASKTTVFKNVYNEHNERIQFISSRALTLYQADIPISWKQVPLVKLCLIADELDISILSAFPNAIVGATIQGWLRQWNEQGKITPKSMNWEWLQYIDVVLFSEDDIIGFEDKLSLITEYVKVAVMTKGKDGAIVYYNKQATHFPAFPVTQIDPTGAGDVFATAFLYHYSTHNEIDLAAAYAHSAASFVVEGLGVQLPSKVAVDKRFQKYRNLFF